MIRILVTSDPKYKDWNVFREHMTNLIFKIQYEHNVSKEELYIKSNIPMAIAWARKNDVPSSDFKEDWDNVDRVIAFDSGDVRMKERIVKAESYGLIVYKVPIEVK